MKDRVNYVWINTDRYQEQGPTLQASPYNKGIRTPLPSKELSNTKAKNREITL